MDGHDVETVNRLRALLLEAYRAMPYAEYLQTDHWQEVRALALRRRLGQGCVLCGGDGGGLPFHVHHSRYTRLGHEWPEDLVILCAFCHNLFHQGEIE